MGARAPSPAYTVPRVGSPALRTLGEAFIALYTSGARPAGRIQATTRRRVEAGVAKLQTVEMLARAYGKRVVVRLEDAVDGC